MSNPTLATSWMLADSDKPGSEGSTPGYMDENEENEDGKGPQRGNQDKQGQPNDTPGLSL